MQCNECGADRWGVRSSCFPGWDLLACLECDRPVRLLPIDGPRPRAPAPGKAETNRALRAARRRAWKELA